FLKSLRVGALVVVLTQAFVLAISMAVLSDDLASWSIPSVLGSTVMMAGLVRIAAGILALGATLALRQMPATGVRGAVLLGATLLLSASGALTSHAIGRLDDRTWLLILTALHQTAVGLWAGGLVCAVMLTLGASPSVSVAWLRRFSAVAAMAVAGIAV